MVFGSGLFGFFVLQNSLLFFRKVEAAATRGGLQLPETHLTVGNVCGLNFYNLRYLQFLGMVVTKCFLGISWHRMFCHACCPFCILYTVYIYICCVHISMSIYIYTIVEKQIYQSNSMKN